MEIFIVERTSGSYDSYTKWVDKIFIDFDKANNYVIKKNLQLDRIRSLAKSLMLKDEDNELDFNDINWYRYHEILEQGSFYLNEFEVTE